MKLSPRIIPGGLGPSNKHACDWCWQGLLAYGCHNFVVVLDPKTVQVVQTFHQYPSTIVKVRWARDSFHHDVNSPYTLKLAVADQSGHVMIWDAVSSNLLVEFVEAGKSVQEMYWMHQTEAFTGCLMVLHSPGLLVLLNTDTGTKLWKVPFNEPLVSFALDPFDAHNIAVQSQEWIMFLHGLNTSSPPAEKSKKFYITSNASSSSSVGSGSASSIGMKSASSKSAFAKMKSWAGDIRGRNDEESLPSSECYQIAYSLTNRGHFLLLFSREILILDLEFGQAVGSFAVEKNSPSFLQIIPCKFRDAYFCLLNNGSVTLKLRRSPASVPYDQNGSHASSRLAPDIYYDSKCHSDVIRLSRPSHIMGFSVCPKNEQQVSLLLSDGRVLFWELTDEPQVKTMDGSDGDRPLHLGEMIPPLVQFHGTAAVPTKQPKIKFMLTGMYKGVASNPTCLKMCPPLTTKNWAVYKPFAAVGSSGGLVQIFNVADGSLHREVAVHSSPVKGLEWFNLSTILSFAHSSSGSAKSEIQMIDVRTGQNCTLPSSRGLNESQVTCIKVSNQRQYFIVLFKNNNPELWDAVTMSQLREFPESFPSITALEWSPSHYSAKLKKKHAAKSEPVPSYPGSGSDSVGTVLQNSKHTEQKTSYTKEHFVFTNADGIVYHYFIEGTSMKDGSRVPPEGGMSAVTYITWKGDLLVLGDVDGNLNIWNLKGKLSRVFPSHRGTVKRMKFAPGKNNMKLMVLFADGIDIWEANEVSMSLKTNKDQPSVVDADWLSSDMPLLLLSDRSMRVLHATMRTSNSPIADKDLEEPIFLPRSLLPKPQMIFRNLLQHQIWNSKYDLDFSDVQEDDIRELLKPAIETLPREFSSRLRSTRHGTAERCCIVSKIFGDEFDFAFWTVALHYLRKETGKRNCNLHKAMDSTNKRRSSYKDVVYADGTKGILRTDSQPVFPLIDMTEDEIHVQTTSTKCACYHAHLDSCHDVLCDNDFYQTLQLYNIALRDGKRSTPEQSRTCAGKLILIGETDRAVQILLEADPTDASYYSDALRACLIATVRSSGASQSTIKLVATNLIANGKLSEGIELLCLVDKGVEACRYLQTYGQWDLATWLAKVSLSQQDFVNVLLRWVDHLSSTHMNQKNKALLVLLSIGDFPRALEIMYSLGQINRAVLFLESCLEFGLLSLTDEQHRNLYESIFVEYARQMHRLGLNKAVGYYCSKAGGRGRKLLDELSNSNSSLEVSKRENDVKDGADKGIADGSHENAADMEGSTPTN